MTDEKIEDLLIGISNQLGIVSTKIDAMSDTLVKHESRLRQLEDTVTNLRTSGGEDFKTEMLRMMSKCLIIGLTALASLTGAGTILSKLLGLNG